MPTMRGSRSLHGPENCSGRGHQGFTPNSRRTAGAERARTRAGETDVRRTTHDARPGNALRKEPMQGVPHSRSGWPMQVQASHHKHHVRSGTPWCQSSSCRAVDFNQQVQSSKPSVVKRFEPRKSTNSMTEKNKQTPQNQSGRHKPNSQANTRCAVNQTP